MKKALSLFLAFIMIFGIVAVGISEAPHFHAEAAQSTFLENNFYYTVSDGKATVVDYADKLSTDEILIPETLGGYPVTEIGKEAFRGSLCTSVRISATVTEIHSEAFAYDMPNLEAYYVDEANSVFSNDDYGVLYTKISGYTAIFAYPKNSSAKIYETKIDIGKYVLPFAFTEVKNLEEVYTRGPSNSRVENYAFYGAVDLKKVFIDDCVFVGEKAFANCEKLADINLDYDIKRRIWQHRTCPETAKERKRMPAGGLVELWGKMAHPAVLRPLCPVVGKVGFSFSAKGLQHPSTFVAAGFAKGWHHSLGFA